jgi:DNA-directed RNA polymerase I subunit RPA1
MLKLDKDLISDRLTGTSYSFYTDEEIMRLSVKNILNPTAFDQLGKPLPGGLYDRALGVSPFDARSTCITCGLDCNHCPGHVGHIDLVVPVYNPFLVNQVYKLLKSKCLHCNRLRIPVKKIDIFTMSLKLIKSGQVVHSQTVKAHFMNAAKEVQLLNDQQKLDPKKLEHLARKLDDLLSSRKKDEQVERGDLQHYFRRLDKTFNKKKKAYQQNLIELLNEFTTHHKEEPLLTPSQ